MHAALQQECAQAGDFTETREREVQERHVLPEHLPTGGGPLLCTAPHLLVTPKLCEIALD